ncbi:MAG: ATP citrate lyase citrate-binding domain-containing protein [bacterium]|nr:ATP citrate lyase citrate-binding domain-containing protein [bacterium]
MARVKITEYRAKKLILSDAYQGVPVGEGIPFDSKKKGRFVIKVDQGIKKRFKQGLVAIDQPAAALPKVIASWKKKDFTRFLAEPYLPHDESEEKYLSLERVRDGIRMLYGDSGGIDIEAHPEAVRTFFLASPQDAAEAARSTGLPKKFLENLLQVFEENFFSFLEINPLVLRGPDVYLLDAAALVDSAGAFFVRNSWKEGDIVESKTKHPSEERVQALGKTTPASVKLNVVNPDGSLFFLLSGGGGSIVIADEAALKGAEKKIGNYGEYSGGPTREETYLYAREIVTLLLASNAKKKALVIAGGVANFTDVKETFSGIIDALSEKAPSLRKKQVKVFVRRGGPNEEAGLSAMRVFLKKEKLIGSVHGSDSPITSAVDEAIRFVGV